VTFQAFDEPKVIIPELDSGIVGTRRDYFRLRIVAETRHRIPVVLKGVQAFSRCRVVDLYSSIISSAY